jgi:exosortase C (VPDSG-CTERM-specific)
MSEAEETVLTPLVSQRPGAVTVRQDLSHFERLRITWLAGYIGLVTLLFLEPLVRLLGLVLQDELHSYIALIPLTSGYLLWVHPRRAVPFRSSLGGAIPLAAFAVAALTPSRFEGWLSANDNLSLMMLAYVSLILAGGFLFLGSKWMATAAFPVAFLIFMVPLPDAAVEWLEHALAAASADAAAFFFNLSGTPLFRRGTTLTLPGMVLEVARECSGIRSTVVLFVTSVLASHLFLKRPWHRAALIAFVVPLAIVRNGVRILVIGLLCVHVGPHMSESFIHRRGGPVFFVFSLVPLLLFMLWLRRHDRSVNLHR